MTDPAQAAATHLRRGDTITAVAGESVGLEIVQRVDIEDGTATIITRRGPQRRQIVRHLPATVPVTTDPPLLAWRRLDRRPVKTGRGAEVAAAVVAGAVMGLVTTRRPRNK